VLMSKKEQAQAFFEKKKAKVKKDCGCKHG
jgi:hypothetical protein